eukprot:9155112-Pyramimonas_sp.AAC.1
MSTLSSLMVDTDNKLSQGDFLKKVSKTVADNVKAAHMAVSKAHAELTTFLKAADTPADAELDGESIQLRAEACALSV